jgi:Flp pilus assembly protein TadB
MRANDPAAVLWAAVLCACVLLWTVVEGGGPRRRARRTIGGGGDGRKRTAAGGSGGKPGEWLREAAAGLRCRVERCIAQPDAERPGRWHGWAARLGRWARVEALCLPAGALLAVATQSVLPLLAGAVAVPLTGRALRRRAERAAAERGAAAVGALCGVLAGDLRAGRPPHAALGDTIEAAGWPDAPELAGAARLLLSAARFGGDVPEALRAAARLSEGMRGLAAVAACWQVAVDGGAGLAAALDRVAAALRAEADQRDDLRAQLAGPRSTAGLLALLPLFGVVLGAGLGAQPARILLHTATGLVCLLAGGLLEWAGLVWTARIIRAAENGPGPRRPGADRGRVPGDSGGPGDLGGPDGGGGTDGHSVSRRSSGSGGLGGFSGPGWPGRSGSPGGTSGLGRPGSSGGPGNSNGPGWPDRGGGPAGSGGFGDRGRPGGLGRLDGSGRSGGSRGPGGPVMREVAGPAGGVGFEEGRVRAVSFVAVAGAWSVHSLGTVVAALMAAGGAVAVAADGGRQRKRVGRLRAALGEVRMRRPESDRLRQALGGPVRCWGPAAAAGIAAGVLAGGALGVLVGLFAAAGVVRVLSGRQRAAGGRTAPQKPDPAQLPLCADLMAACLAAGASPGEAAGAVGGCLGGPLGAALIRAQAELRLGGDPVECWQRFGAVLAAREMGRCLARASTTGTAPVAEMSRLAADLRAAHGRTALAGARKAAVLATAPLGLCFLPAFLLVGVVPVVIGLAGAVLGAGNG